MTWNFNFTDTASSDAFHKYVSGNGSPFDIVIYFGQYVNGTAIHPEWSPAYNFSTGYYLSKMYIVTNTTVYNTKCIVQAFVAGFVARINGRYYDI